MELKSVIGTRRSIRFFEPWRPVEHEKIQRIVEAIYRAPRLLETDFVRTVVVYRDKLSAEQLQAAKTPTTTAQLDMAYAYIFFFADVAELEKVADGRNFRELIRRGILNSSHGWTEGFVDETVVPHLRSVLESGGRVPVQFQRGADGPTVARQVLAAARHAAGAAQAYGLLAAVDQGLGVQLSAFSHARIMTIPDTWAPVGSPMFLGYPGESIEAGGQRPREPFEEDFFELRYGHPFYREPAVVKKLEDALMIQAPAPFGWRFEELRGLAKKYGLPD
jgi:nitroreductase